MRSPANGPSGMMNTPTSVPPPLPPNTPHQGTLREVGDLPSFAIIRSVGALILREMSSTYGRSPGGYVWAILEPVLLIGVMAVIFSIGFRTPPIGTNFAIYYASGVMPFVMFTTVTNKVSQAVNFSNQLLSYPRVTFWDAIIARFILTVILQLTISFIIFASILLTWDTRTILDLPVIAGSFAMAAGLGLGVGFLNCLLTTRYALWNTVWAVLNRPMILISGVIFPITAIPQPYREWLEWNPLLHIVSQSRNGFYYNYDGDYIDPIYVCAVAATCGFFGLMLVRRFFRNSMER